MAIDVAVMLTDMRHWRTFCLYLIALSSTRVGAQTTDGYRRAAQLLLEAIDETKNPCENFYGFACGKWRAANQLQPGENLRVSFTDVAKKVDRELEGLLAECAYGGSKAINAVKILYDACMNKERFQPKKSYEVIHNLVNFGYWPIIQPKWDAADYDLTQLLIHVAKSGFTERLVNVNVGPNNDDSSQNLLTIVQDQPTLGGAYLEQSDNGKQLLEMYESAVNGIVSVIAQDTGSCRTAEEIATDVKDIIRFERQLAEIIEADEPGIDPAQKTNFMKLSDLARLVPVIDWQRFCREVFPPATRAFVDSDPTVNLVHVAYMQKLTQLLQRTSSRTVTNYVLYRYVLEHGDSLDHRIDAIKQTLQPSEPRQKTCMELVKDLLPQAVGAIYVRRYFSQTDKGIVREQMEDLRIAFGNIIQASGWMDTATKQYALEKLHAMEFNVGAPEYDYSDQALDAAHPGVSLSATDSYATMVHKLRFAVSQHSLSTLPFRQNNRKEFEISPVDVNAYQNFNKNAVFMLASILQGSFFDREFPRSINYGSIGYVVGHELTHGFDNRGASYDKNGNYRSWWDPATYQTFVARTRCLIDQYSRFQIPELSGKKVNGELTQGENIADNGGVKEAYQAYREHVRKLGREEPPLPGLERYTQDQIFFLSLARTYCTNISPEEAERLRVSDTHSPGRFRVLGTLMNSEEFARTFQCPTGSPMNPVQKCAVW